MFIDKMGVCARKMRKIFLKKVGENFVNKPDYFFCIGFYRINFEIFVNSCKRFL